MTLWVVSSQFVMKFHLDCFENSSRELIFQHFLLFAQDGSLENVVDLSVSGLCQHCQHHLVTKLVLGQMDDVHLRLFGTDSANLFDDLRLLVGGSLLESCDNNRVTNWIQRQFKDFPFEEAEELLLQVIWNSF